MISPSLALYVHIPFCQYKCHYCDFNSGPFTNTARQIYLQSLQREILNSPLQNSMAKTVYFGGGTPSELDSEELGRLVLALQQSFLTDSSNEWTIECNPGSVTPVRWRSLRVLGFNRISLGVQSFSDVHLQNLGRIHSASDARKSFYWAREAGFRNINLDLLFGLPGQTLEQWESDLQEAISLSPEHLSLYGLNIEVGTRIFRRIASKELRKTNEDLSATMYERSIELAREAGYLQYEISSFAKPGRQCIHNLSYWHNKPYLGFGLSASSFIEGIRWTNSGSFSEYFQKIESGQTTRKNEEHLKGLSALGEEIMLRLQTEEGFSTADLSLRYTCDINLHFGETIRFLCRQGLVNRDQGWIRLTRRGKLLANEVWMQFLA
mgnify:CR=1 FL=1